MAENVGNYDVLGELQTKLAKLADERQGMELEWLEASEILE